MRKHPLANCEECPLASTGTFVPSGGNRNGELAFVGEAPGNQEAITGQPFTGPSGRLLNLVLRMHNIERKEVFLSNACLCRPSDGSTPTRQAIVACRPRLLHELGSVRTVIALGNSAAESLLGKTGITKLRVGPGRTSDYLPGVRIIPSIHPAACLRQGDSFPFLVTDIGKVQVSATTWEPPSFWVAETPEEALYAIHFLRRTTGTLVVDIECAIDKENSFDHPNRYGMLCVGIGWAKKRAIVFGEHCFTEQVWRELGSLLRARDLVGQNYKFDGAGLYPLLGATEAVGDTMLASYVFDERPGIHGLKHQAVELLGAPRYDEEIKQYVGTGGNYGRIPRPILYKYNAYDLACTFDLWEMYSERLCRPENAGLKRVHDLLVAASNQLMFVELNGIAIDRDYLQTLAREYLQRIVDLEADIDSVLGEHINPRSPQQVKAALLKRRLKVASTDVSTLTKALEVVHGHERYETVTQFITLLLKHRREAKLYGTYIKGTAARLYRGRVYPTFLLHGTTTGRLACRNPNLQNVPRESSIRKLYIPARPGNVFVQTDYSQAELRFLSFLAGDNYFRDIFNGGDRDLFDELSAILYPTINKSVVGPAAWKELRIRVKAYVYGLAYGRTEFSIATEFGISVREAKQNMDTFFNVIPEIVTFREQTRRSVLAGKYLETPWGRRRRFGLITNENRSDIMNEALAFIPQSTSSDACLLAMTWARKELRGKAFIRNIVHDSILAECLPEDTREVSDTLDRLMVDSARTIVGDYVRFATESKIGNNWGEV